MLKKTLIAICGIAVAILLVPVSASAQSGCSYIAYGAVLTAEQWNKCFAAKQNSLGYVPVNKDGDVMLGKLVMTQSSVTAAGLNLPQGSAPSSPVNGDMWTTLAGVFARINNVTVGPFGSISGANFAATPPLAVSFVGSLGTFSINIDSNFAVSGGNLALAPIASGSLLANSGGSSAEPVGTTPSAWFSRWCSGTAGNFPYASGASTWGCLPLFATANTWTAKQSINLNASSLASPLSGSVLQLQQADATIARVELDAFGATPIFSCVRGDGTKASTTALLVNDEICALNAWGYTAPGTLSATAAASYRVFAAENWSSGHQGTYTRIATTPVAGTALADIVSFENDGSIIVPPSITGGSKGAGTINAAGLYINGVAVTSAGITALTGDGTATGPGSAALTLATVNSNVGSFGGASSVPSFTVNGKGLITAASVTTVVAPAGTLTGTTLNSTVVTSSLTSVGSLVGGSTGAGFTIALGSSTITGILPLANGGANAALTASNGGVVYSTASALAVLPGTVTAGQCLLSGSSAAPSWGSCSGAASVSSVTNADSTLTISPTTGAVVASLNLGQANTWTAAQTFPASGILLKGSSTGLTTFTSANAGASNFTVTVPAATDTLANLAGTQTLSNKTLVAPALGTPASGVLTNATGLPIGTGVSGLGTGIATALAVNTGSSGAPSILIASGASAMGTSAIASAACATVVTATATGTATTDVLTASFNADPTAVTGYVASTSGMLTIFAYPTANTANFKVCNNTSASITPGAVTINWRVVR